MRLLLLEYGHDRSKNLHLEHVEDEMFNTGKVGLLKSVRSLKKFREYLEAGSAKGTSMSLKYDGSPAVFVGINPENGKFFVGTKSIFAKGSKLNYTEEDINFYYGDKPDLAEKLKYALRYLSELNIHDILQGDLLYIRPDLKTATIYGNRYIVFKPNVITYAVPVDSELADKITRSQIGVVFHTTYTGSTMASMSASFGVDISKLSPSKNVWYTSAEIKGIEVEKIPEDLLVKINDLFSLIDLSVDNIDIDVLDKIVAIPELALEIKTFNNARVRSTSGLKVDMGIVEKFKRYIEDRIATKRLSNKKGAIILEFISDHSDDILDLLALHSLMSQVKNLMLFQVSNVGDIKTFWATNEGYSPTSIEGLVMVYPDGSALKFVDREEFSRQNFLASDQRRDKVGPNV